MINLTRHRILSDANVNTSRPPSELQSQKLDVEEMKIGREADYMSDVIKQRQEDLDNVETLMNDVNSIAKQINVNIHKQREAVVQIETNAETALENAEAANDNVIQA